MNSWPLFSPCLYLLGFPVGFEEDDDHPLLDRPLDVPQYDPARVRPFHDLAQDLVNLAVDPGLGPDLDYLGWISFRHQNHFFSGLGSFLIMSASFSEAPPAFSTATADVPTAIPIAPPRSFLDGTNAYGMLFSLQSIGMWTTTSSGVTSPATTTNCAVLRSMAFVVSLTPFFILPASLATESISIIWG